ncbi:hypothetical protein [Skermania pinensis]|uniref:hypothetical protein n=1 Tax=Skermania pinensis TaxID=39122 RepID=UPI000B1199EB|nr:hypothetical protein [Skermania piniformis]
MTKDIVFAASLLDAHLVDLDILSERAGALPRSGPRVQSWLQAYQRRNNESAGADSTA